MYRIWRDRSYMHGTELTSFSDDSCSLGGKQFILFVYVCTFSVYYLFPSMCRNFFAPLIEGVLAFNSRSQLK